MLNWINTNLNELQYIILLFATFFFYNKLNGIYYLKRLLKIKLTKKVMPLDCYPCTSFWITLIVTFNPIVAMAVYMTAVIIDRKNV